MSVPPSSQSLSPEEVLALCREIRDVVRAGIPLQLGLQAGGISPRQERVLEGLAHRLQSGMSLAEALQAEETALPPLLRAVVIAGVRTGRVDELLEDVTESSHTLRSLRQVLLRGLVYPAFVFVLAGLLGAIVLPVLWARLALVYETASVDQGVMGWAPWLAQLPWIFLTIVVLIGLVGWLWPALSRRELSGWGVFAYVPIMGGIVRDHRLARAVQVLSLLVKYAVPLPEALRVAASTADSPLLMEDLNRLAQQVEQGAEFKFPRRSQLPRFLQWMITLGQRESRLPATLADAAAFYRDRAMQRGEFSAKVFPGLVLAIFGGGITLAYAASVFGPLTALWSQLGKGT